MAVTFHGKTPKRNPKMAVPFHGKNPKRTFHGKNPKKIVDWLLLPEDLLWKISTRINNLSDHVRFRAVCKTLRSLTPATPAHLPCQPPWLLSAQDSSRTIFSFVEVVAGNKRYRHRLAEPLSRRHWRYRGSSHGWLVILDRSRFVTVLNPLTGAKLNLPPLSALPPVTHFNGWEYNLLPKYKGPWVCCTLRAMRDLFMKKLILSDCPSRNPNFTALAIFHLAGGKDGGNLACCKSGQDHWTLVPGTYVDDAVYFQGKVYTVRISKCIIHTFDVNCNSPKIEEMEIIGSEKPKGDAFYLVPMRDELFLVSRFFNFIVMEEEKYRTLKFKVHRLNFSEKKWERVYDLGDRALFVGGNSCSSAIMASAFPGCRGNSIYYTDDDGQLKFRDGLPEKYDMGIFCLDDKSLYSFCNCRVSSACECDVRVSRANPTWLTPNPFQNV